MRAAFFDAVCAKIKAWRLIRIKNDFRAPIRHALITRSVIQYQIQREKDREHYHIDHGKVKEIVSLLAAVFPSLRECGVESVCDEACHTCDERAETAKVGTDDERLAVLCKCGKEHGCGNVADDLR